MGEKENIQPQKGSIFFGSVHPVKLLLAPMQDVTDLAFWRLLERYGGADAYVTEYIRVYPGSRIDRDIERDILENNTGKPVIAQIAGEDPMNLERIVRELQLLPVAGIDLNLGCPAKVVCRKRVGGALLKDLLRVELILRTLREAVIVPLSVKCRPGYENAESFDELLKLFSDYKVDWVTVHGRTVRQGYAGKADWNWVYRAAERLDCPVCGNGDLSDPQECVRLLREEKCGGLMIGRGAVRNPWIFQQIREALRGEQINYPTGRQMLEYLFELEEMTAQVEKSRGELAHVERIKKFLNFIGLGIGNEFLYQVRRVRTRLEMESVWKNWLDHTEELKLIPIEQNQGKN